MEENEISEQEKARIKAEKLEYRRKIRNSRIFMGIGCLAEIILSLGIIVLLFLALIIVQFRLFHATGAVGQIVFQVISVAIFVAGMVLGLVAYKALARWAIRRFHLEDKLHEDMLKHYEKKSRGE